MAVFKCKMCGAALEVTEGSGVASCEYCGTAQTLPKLGDERRVNLYERAGHFRRANEFDKAVAIYEQILNEDTTDAEAYWSLVLCRFGIEYVEDPSTGKRVPTIHRAQPSSIFADEDYKCALENADAEQRAVYEAEAKAIDDIHKGILDISRKEKPFDVFICYKETDEDGQRTHDSVLANDLYHQLKAEGFNVFFARITLESKLGSSYEPYIFAALNSAKVMVVLGTKPQYFEAVWVKNEWARFLSLAKNDSSRMLIPAYKDMDPYDLPAEFAHLQAQDMSKLGFMQDLIRGIKKILNKDEPGAENSAAAANNNATLLKRAFLFLEDGDFQRADGNCEQVLDADPENAEAYLIKLMIALGVKRRGELADLGKPFSAHPQYEKAYRFGDSALRQELDGYNKHITERNALDDKTRRYNDAQKRMQESNDEHVLRGLADIFRGLGDFKDSAELTVQCSKLAEDAHKNGIYDEAYSLYERDVPDDLAKAAELFSQIPEWRDAEDLKYKSEAKREKILADTAAAKARAEKKAKIKRIVTLSVLGAVVLGVVITMLTILVFIPNSKYAKAEKLLEDGSYVESYLAFLDLGGHKDSKERAEEIKDEHPGVSQPGDSVVFGSFEQDGDINNGKEELEWIVLANEDGKLLLISKYAVDAKPYNSDGKATFWSNSSIRAWLNYNFLGTAFDEGQREEVILTDLENPENPEHKMNGGEAPQDKVFLLSGEEFEESFASIDGASAAATKYAKDIGAADYGDVGTVWWLRTPGYTQSFGAHVSENGYVGYYGSTVNTVRGVRPAIWINAEALDD